MRKQFEFIAGESPLDEKSASTHGDVALAATVAAPLFPPPKADMRRRIGLMLLARGPMARMPLAKAVLWPQTGRKSNILRAMRDMQEDGQLVLKGRLLDIPESVRGRYLALAAEPKGDEKAVGLVPPRAPPVFKPLSARFIPSLAGPRDCPVREFHPVSMSSRVRDPLDYEGEVG